MESILNYNPKDYKSRNFGLGFASRLIKSGIKNDIDNSSNKIHHIKVELPYVAEANLLLNTYKKDIAERKRVFAKAIKVNYSKAAPFVVDSLYSRLKVIPEISNTIWLPDGWKGGKSIQNYSQTDFYSFAFVQITGSAKMNGYKVLVSTLSQKKVWILSPAFQSSISGLIEDKKMEGKQLTSIDQLLDHLSLISFSGEEWKGFIDSKRLFQL